MINQNKIIWELLQYFNRDEAWGDPDKVNGLVLLILDRLRGRIGKPFKIHNAYDLSGHVDKSQHYLGNAVDFHIVTNINFKLLYLSVESTLSDLQCSNVGLGVYPEWNNPGFHLDVRGSKARWAQIDNKYVSIKNLPDSNYMV